FGVEAKFVLIRMKRGDPLKQRAVQIDFAHMTGEPWRDLPFDRLKFIIGVGGRQIKENGGNTGKASAAPLQCFDRIFEGRRFWVGSDCRSLGLRADQRGLEGWPIIAWLQAVERRRFKWPRPCREKRVSREGIVFIHGTAIQFLRRFVFIANERAFLQTRLAWHVRTSAQVPRSFTRPD